MKIAVIERIKKLPKQTEETLHDALSVLFAVEDRKSVDHYVKWIRAEAKKLRTESKYFLPEILFLWLREPTFGEIIFYRRKNMKMEL